MDSNIKREIILDNYSHPYHKENKDNQGFIKENSSSESCIDDIDLFVKIENNRIEDIYFDGEACAISTASTSIMIKNLIGKTIEEAKEYINNFQAMLNEEHYDNENLNEAEVFDETYKQGNRKTCVMLPYYGFLKIIDKYLNSL